MAVLPWLAWSLLFVTVGNLFVLAYNDLIRPPAHEWRHQEENHRQDSIASPITRSQMAATINQAALFGRLDAAAVAEVANPIETRLDLTLVATFTHRDPALAIALISESGMPPVRYRIGDLIQGDAELIEVRAGSVILKRNERHESLSLAVMVPQF